MGKVPLKRALASIAFGGVAALAVACLPGFGPDFEMEPQRIMFLMWVSALGTCLAATFLLPFKKTALAIFLILFCVLFFLFPLGKAGPSAKRASCFNNLKQIYLALGQYCESESAYPSGTGDAYLEALITTGNLTDGILICRTDAKRVHPPGGDYAVNPALAGKDRSVYAALKDKASQVPWIWDRTPCHKIRGIPMRCVIFFDGHCSSFTEPEFQELLSKK